MNQIINLVDTQLVIKLKNPGSVPSGLPLTLTTLVGAVVAESKTFATDQVKFDFVKNVATLPVVAGERCTFILSSMTLKVNGTTQQVTYKSTDKPLLIALNSNKKAQTLVEPQENVVSMDLVASREEAEKMQLPTTLWFAVMASPYTEAVVGIDFTRAQAIVNVRS